MKKTLLLVFIHGFKGGDDTFAGLPTQLRELVSQGLPHLEVLTVTYPKFETKGDLMQCVGRFREWLQDYVIDIEVANGAPSPTVDPSVHVMLIGHSMGGIVAAETLLLLASEQLLPAPSNLSSSRTSESEGKPVEPNAFMFPHIQGLLAFDTPFLGIAPGVVSYTAENQYKTATAAYGAISEVAGVFGWGTGKKKDNKAEGTPATRGDTKPAPASLPPTTSSSPSSSTLDNSMVDAAEVPSWQRWGRYAMYAGAAGAVAAGGAAALYSHRDKFLEGFSWATSHLEFVGCLARPEELRRRMMSIAKLQQERGIGAADFYTCLGKGALDVPSGRTTRTTPSPTLLTRYILRSKLRTFCNLPNDVEESDNKDDKATYSNISGIKWIKATNDKATDETRAHMSMFVPGENPSFYDLASQASQLLVRWVDKGWYSTADSPGYGGDKMGGSHGSQSAGERQEFIDADDVVLVD
ncbi:hypothetical protein FQN55_009152 [Onygenales sp. PD_40]|nr:hypothetical protein FQN55_009152 [Onygenales sp. PD_40]KAK2786105.1 hypothetical protein FQN52_007984 [Onygenales sp. PD_12]KAK2797668.1 hypothetical protein FQN51_008362 [Onygenales sp. PD_10]